MVKLDSIFKIYARVENILDEENELLDIIVNKDQISFRCRNYLEFIKLDALKPLMGLLPKDISIFSDNLYISYRGISEEIENASNDVKMLKDVIDLISEKICQCPILEMVITDYYVKVYIDKPNIKIKDLAGLDEIFESEGVLETGEQRAYVIYVKE